MRFRPANLRKEKPEIFKKIIKNNPYKSKVYDYPSILIPHPTPETFQKLWENKIIATNNNTHSRKIHLEIGCGSGRYLIEWALKNPQDSFLGLELRYKRIVLAAKKIERQSIQNIILIRERGEFIDEYLPQNSIDYLHINFPDPWSKRTSRKHRILNPDFLKKIQSVICSGGEFRFKTDHIEYFETVSNILKDHRNYTIVEHTSDLHKSIYSENNILTEFEMLFKSKEDPPIHYLLAKKK